MIGKGSNFLLPSLPDTQALTLFLLIFRPPGQFNCSISARQPVQAQLPGAAVANQTSAVSDGKKHTKWGRPRGGGGGSLGLMPEVQILG